MPQCFETALVAAHAMCQAPICIQSCTMPIKFPENRLVNMSHILQSDISAEAYKATQGTGSRTATTRDHQNLKTSR
jgi:hypothetical protein